MSYNITSRTIVDDGSNAIADGTSIYDSKKALGTISGTTITPASSSDLGGLCTFATINPWSKYKPVIYLDNTTGEAILNTINSDQAQQDGNGNWTWKTLYGSTIKPWWKGWIPSAVPLTASLVSGRIYDCGFFIKVCSTDDLVSAYKEGTEDTYFWKYSPPASNSTYKQGFRLTDFLGYKSNAAELYTNWGPGGDVFGVNQSITLTLAHRLGASNTSDKSLVFGDFRVLSDCHFGVALWKKGSNDSYYTIKDSNEIDTYTSSGSAHVDIPAGSLTEGVWNAAPFLVLSGGSTSLQVSNIAAVYPLTLRKAEFQVTQDPLAWIRITGVEWGNRQTGSALGTNTIDITITFTTWKGTGEGNYQNSNSVGVYSVRMAAYNKTLGHFDIESGTIDAGNSLSQNSYVTKYEPSPFLYNPVAVVPCHSVSETTSSSTATFSCTIGSDWTVFQLDIAARVYKNTSAWDSGESYDAVYTCPKISSNTGSTSDSTHEFTPITNGQGTSGQIDIEPGGWDTGQHDNDNNIP